MKNFLKKIIVAILTLEAELILKKYHPRIIAVTGNVGKTSTKEAIAAVLSTRFKVRKSEKSYNSELGVPLTIIGAQTAWMNPIGWTKNIFRGLYLILFPNHYPDTLVLEVGADRPGDIESLMTWLRPSIGVVTFVGELPVHVEYFASPEAVAKEKSFVARTPRENGLVILNHDNPTVFAMRSVAKAPVVTFGFDERSTACASGAHIMYRDDVPVGVMYQVNFEGKTFPVRISGMLGKQAVYATLPSVLVGVHCGLNIVEIGEALSKHEPVPGRSHILEGVRGSMIVDDSYNSSPHALTAALDVLDELQVSGKKIAVLGDMMELGKYTIDAHTEAGARVAKTASLLLAVGQRGKFIGDGAEKAGMSRDAIKYFDDSQAAGEWLQNELHRGDAVLVKGSQFIRLEKCVKEIMARPEEAKKLLVRQEKEWLER